MNERKSSDPFHEELEWDRDGQYYHYLTRWMHALNRVSRVTGDMTYLRWAMELAKTAHARFTYVPRSGGEKRMYWKMSIDLSYPLVPSMGQHDPIDGLVTYLELQARAPNDAGLSPVPDLREEIAELERMCEGKRWATDDALGIGGLLCDVYRVAQLLVNGKLYTYDFRYEMPYISIFGGVPGYNTSITNFVYDIRGNQVTGPLPPVVPEPATVISGLLGLFSFALKRLKKK